MIKPTHTRTPPSKQSVLLACHDSSRYATFLQGGVAQLQFARVLRRAVLPVILNLSTALALPYVATYGLLPLLPGLSAMKMAVVRSIAHSLVAIFWLLVLSLSMQYTMLMDLHDELYDERYCLGKRLVNYKPPGTAGINMEGAGGKEAPHPVGTG